MLEVSGSIIGVPIALKAFNAPLQIAENGEGTVEYGAIEIGFLRVASSISKNSS